MLLACNTGRARERAGVEYQSLATTSLLAGSVSTIGTMFRIYTGAARKLGRKFAKRLKPVLEQSNGTTFFDVARALQEMVKEMRKAGDGPELWTPFVVHGTPLLLVLHMPLADPL